jgi:hypothetical protein
MANKFTDAVFHAKLPALDKAVLWAIAHRTDNETGACHPSLKTVSKEGGACTTIVKQVIAYSVEIGLLERKARRDGNINLANEYVFSLPTLRWLERADSRFVPDGETDQGARANLGKLQPQGGKQLTGGLVHGPRVYKRPPQGWGGKRLKNSEVDLVLRSRHSNSDSTQKKTQRQRRQEDTDQDQQPNPRGFAPSPTGTSCPGTPGTYHSDMEAFRIPSTPAQQACEDGEGHVWIDVLQTTQQCSACGQFRTNPAVTQWTEADDFEVEYMEMVECYDPYDTYWSAPEERTRTAANRAALSPSEFARASGAE